MSLVETFPVTDSLEAAASVMRQPGGTTELSAGNVLRRLCSGGACASVCMRSSVELSSSDAGCADNNVLRVVNELGLPPESVVVVSATKDEVGIYEDLLAEGKITQNERGFKEVAGFNAFAAFADSEVAIGMRLADCVSIELEMAAGPAYGSRQVIAMFHLTRASMAGPGQFSHEFNGEKVSVFEFFTRTVAQRFDAAISSVKARNIAAIDEENFPFWFADEAKMRATLKGWHELGLVRNATFTEREGSEWQPGDEFRPNDQWDVDYRGMADWQMQTVLTPEQTETANRVDPGDLSTGHATNAWGRKARVGQFVVGKFLLNDVETMSTVAFVKTLKDDLWLDAADISTAQMFLSRFGAREGVVTRTMIDNLLEYTRTIQVEDARDLYLAYPSSLKTQ